MTYLFFEQEWPSLYLSTLENNSDNFIVFTAWSPTIRMEM